MTRRTPITDRTLLASVLCELLDIPHQHQVLMHEDQLLMLIERDHYPVTVALGGTNHFSNVRALLKSGHRHVTAKRDVPAIAKVKRIARANDAAVNRLLAKDRGEPKPRSNWPKGRKIEGRGFQRRTGNARDHR